MITGRRSDHPAGAVITGRDRYRPRLLPPSTCDAIAPASVSATAPMPTHSPVLADSKARNSAILPCAASGSIEAGSSRDTVAGS